MRIFSTASGDYRVTSEHPFTGQDIVSIAHKIARESDGHETVFDWPIITDEFDGEVWQLWFVAPETDNAYLNHEELV